MGFFVPDAGQRRGNRQNTLAMWLRPAGNAGRGMIKRQEERHEAERSSNGADGLMVFVENEGKAVSKKIIEAVNKPFNLDEDIMKHSEGLGLGLSLSQALLKAHKSGLEFETPKGKTRVGFRI